MLAIITHSKFIPNTTKPLLLIAVAVLLGACASHNPKDSTVNKNATTHPRVENKQANQHEQSLSNKKRISRQTLEGLMLAEIAGQRGKYHYALNAYLNQAKNTQDPNIAERTLDIAQFVNDSKAQKTALDIWLKSQPESTLALAKAAEFRIQSGDFIKAFSYMQKLEELNANAPYHYLAIFGKDLETSQKQQLLAKIKAQKSRNKENEVNRLYAQGMLLQQFKEYRQSIKYYDRALAKQPERTDIGLQKARLLLAQNKPQKALDWVNELYIEQPYQKGIALLRARLLIRTNRPKEALDAFARLHQQHPFDADILFALSLLELDMGQERAAKQHLDALINQHQKLDQAHYYLGRLALSKNQSNTALKHFKKVTGGRELLPAKSHIVNILYTQKGINTALDYLHQIKAPNSKSRTELLILEAELFIQDKQFDQAMNVYNKVLKTEPKNEDLLYARSILAIQQKNLDLAEQDLKCILVLDENNDRALNTLGYTLLVHTQRIEEAKDLINKAYDLNPESPAILDSLGWLYFKLGDLEEAKSLLEEAFAKSQDNEIAAHLGEVLWQRGNKDAAKEVWEKGLEFNPQAEAIKKTMERLNVK